MPFANSSLSGLVGASLVAAAIAFLLRAMPDTNPSLYGSIGTSLVAAAFHLRAMPHTNPFLYGLVGASLVATAFLLCLRAAAKISWSRAAKMTNVIVQD